MTLDTWKLLGIWAVLIYVTYRWYQLSRDIRRTRQALDQLLAELREDVARQGKQR